MENTKIINFDMDGCIADLYGVENWLTHLINCNPLPYRKAKPLVNMNVLARTLNRLKRKGYTINIVSWLSKNSTVEYDKAVMSAKLYWLKKHLKSVKFDNIYIVPYGTPKHEIASGILFDDEKPNRVAWSAIKNNYAYDVNCIIENLKEIEKSHL